MNRDDLVYHLIKPWPRWLWRFMGGVRVSGLHNIPAEGPFLLVSNHLSNLDPLLIQSICPRVVHAMAKSAQFGVPVVGRIMRHIHSFPVRRYQVDPQAVRVALRRLHTGKPVAIYVEGERSWDGRLQDPRIGTLRLILKAGVPVVPGVIRGSYEAWPRWHARPHRHPIDITFGEPLRFPQLDHRDQRDAMLPETGDRLMSAIRALLDHPAPT